MVPEALAQHEEHKQSQLAYGWHTVRVHAFIIGSAGTISKSLHITLPLVAQQEVKYGRDCLIV